MPAKKFIPALKYKILTPMLDPVLSLLMKDALLKSRLVAQLNPRAGDQVLDFGCGTGTLAIMIKKASADTIVTGIDVDPQVLEIARGKAREQDQDTQFIEYPGTALPFSDQSFDKAVTSLVIHHLYAEQKRRAFAELRRVLKRGGELHILDFGVQRSPYTRFITSISRRFEPVEDNLLGKIPAYLTSAGFINVREIGYENTLLGSVSFYLARKP